MRNKSVERRFDRCHALHTSLALRQAIWRKEDARWIVCGIPDVLYTDHGSDFTSRHLEQVGADLKIPLVFSIPGKPRGRGRIERLFRSIAATTLSESAIPPITGTSEHPNRPLSRESTGDSGLFYALMLA